MRASDFDSLKARTLAMQDNVTRIYNAMAEGKFG